MTVRQTLGACTTRGDGQRSSQDATGSRQARLTASMNTTAQHSYDFDYRLTQGGKC